MKFAPHETQTKEQLQLELAEQGYQNIQDHPTLRHFDEETGEMTAEAREEFGVADFVIPVEATPQTRERPLTQRELKKIARIALAGPRVTINEHGVVMTPDEVDSRREDTERAGRY